MKKRIVFFSVFLITTGYVLADALHFSGVVFQGQPAVREPKFGLIFWAGGHSNDSERNLLICPVNFPVSNAILQNMTVRYYDGDSTRAMRIRLMRMSIDTGLPEVQAEWNSDLLGDTGWTKVNSLIYQREIDNNTYSYWIEAFLFGPGSFSSGGYLIALQSVRISYATPWQSISNNNSAGGSIK